MLKKIVAALAVVVVALVAVIATRPATFHLERSAAVNAPASVVFARLNGFASWDDWSPWSKLDPNMKKTLSGPREGVGAHYAWESPQDDVGSGEMTITAIVPNEKVVMDLHFMKPFEARNVTTLSMKPADAPTTVTWSMDGENDFMGKAMSLVMDMDKMVGPDFEKGLASLKALAGADAAKARAESEALAKKAAEDAAALRVERRTTIAAPLEVVFACIDTITAWNLWSPWWPSRPPTTDGVTGYLAGAGATFSWDNDRVGHGELKVTESHFSGRHIGRVALDLQLTKAGEMRGGMTFVLSTSDGSPTTVVWSADGAVDVKDLERGLVSLRTVAEADAASRGHVCRVAAAVAKASRRARDHIYD